MIGTFLSSLLFSITTDDIKLIVKNKLKIQMFRLFNKVFVSKHRSERLV